MKPVRTQVSVKMLIISTEPNVHLEYAQTFPNQSIKLRPAVLIGGGLQSCPVTAQCCISCEHKLTFELALFLRVPYCKDIDSAVVIFNIISMNFYTSTTITGSGHVGSG